jgi:hypothetical protein
MKQAKGPIQKLQAETEARTAKFPCGTLSYLAECRGASQKTASPERRKPADVPYRFERRYPADH